MQVLRISMELGLQAEHADPLSMLMGRGSPGTLTISTEVMIDDVDEAEEAGGKFSKLADAFMVGWGNAVGEDHSD